MLRREAFAAMRGGGAVPSGSFVPGPAMPITPGFVGAGGATLAGLGAGKPCVLGALADLLSGDDAPGAACALSHDRSPVLVNRVFWV
jgi:hypothetical protein